MSRTALGEGTLIAVSLLLHGSLGAQAAPTPAHRTFVKGTWQERTLIRGEVLLDPFLLKVAGRSIVVFDYGDFQVKAFGLDGTLQWRFGRRGQGPWEFADPGDLQVSSAGEILVSDRANSRVTALDLAGAPRRMVPFRNPVRRFLPAAGGGFFASVSRGPYWDRFDRDGNALGSLPVPPFLGGLGHLSAEPISSALEGGRHAVTFRWSDRLLILDAEGGIVASARGPEHLEFPATTSYKAHAAKEGEIIVTRVSPDAVWAALGVTGVGRQVWVLFVGETDDAGRLIDMYDQGTAEYQGSVRLPHRPVAIAGVGDRQLAVLYHDPEPQIDLLTWVPAQR